MGVWRHCLVSRHYFHCLGLVLSVLSWSWSQSWRSLSQSRPWSCSYCLKTKTVQKPRNWWDASLKPHCHYLLNRCAAILSLNLPLFIFVTSVVPRGSCWPPLRQTGEDNWVVPASHGLAPSNRIWNITTLRSPKQQIWLRTAVCGGWCRRMALYNLRVTCQKRRRVIGNE